MHHAELIESIRQIVGDAFEQLRLGGADDVRESLLIREGVYCGRRFEAPSGHALWFFEEDQIKLFGPDGRVLRVIQAASKLGAPARVAA
jgi:hypothetical protein